MTLPKQVDQLFAYELDWNRLNEANVVNRICRPWIAKKIKELMGVEEPMMINIVVKLLMQKCTHTQLLQKIESILDEASQDFVEKLWRVIVFEDIKLKNG